MSFADQFLHKMDTGIPGHPSGEFHEFSFPGKTSDMTLADLGDWGLKIAGWESYWLSVSALLEGEFVEIKEAFEIGIFRYAEEKMSVKAVEYNATQKDENMKKAKLKMIKLKSEIAVADKMVASFKILREALSREQSRRAQELAV